MPSLDSHIEIPFALWGSRCMLGFMRGFLISMAFISSMLFPQQSGWGGDPELALAPPTKEESVTDNYFGTTVRDDYRWLERLDDSKVKATGNRPAPSYQSSYLT